MREKVLILALSVLPSLFLSGCVSSPLESLRAGTTAPNACRAIILNPQRYVGLVNGMIRNYDLKRQNNWYVERIVPDFASASAGSFIGDICPAVAVMSSGYKIHGSFLLIDNPQLHKTTVTWQSDGRSVDAALREAAVKKYGAKAIAAQEAAYAQWNRCLRRASRSELPEAGSPGGPIDMYNYNLEMRMCGPVPSVNQAKQAK